MFYPLARKALFRLDAEHAHELTLQQLRRIGGTPLEGLIRQRLPARPVKCMGLTFKNALRICRGGHRHAASSARQ